MDLAALGLYVTFWPLLARGDASAWGHLNYNESRKSQNQRHEANKNNDTRILAAELAFL
jgi:hypothetical protein